MSGSPATAPAPPSSSPAALPRRSRAGERALLRGVRRRLPGCERHPTFVEDDGYWARSRRRHGLARGRGRARPAVARGDPADRPRAIRRKVPFLLDERRASWVLDLALPEAAAVLDLGAGMGGSLPARPARRTRRGLERVALRARFAAARFAEDGLRQVTVVRGDAHHLPFPPQSFDLVVLSGVLEWLGKGARSRGRAARRAPPPARAPPPGRTLAVGIENRVGIWFFFGRAITTTSVHLASAALAASLVTRLKRGHPYDTYTYTERGYRRLFARAGFGAARTLLPVWVTTRPTSSCRSAPPGRAPRSVRS